MSEASDQLARSRQAIVEQIARRQRKHDPREEPPEGYAFSGGAGEGPSPYGDDDDRIAGGGLLPRLRRAVGAWWTYHPAHMAGELAAPLLRGWARRKPVQMLAISAAAGAALALARPWRLISLTTVAVALLKSSQLSSLVMAALSAADFGKDDGRPE